MPRVSVVTPCYNSVRYVRETVQSVNRQTFPDWEHIVVDDGSTDESAAALVECSVPGANLKLVTQPNSGVARARNRGFAECSAASEYVLFLDADDTLESDMLTRMAAYLDEHPDVGMVHCDPIFIDEHGIEIDAAEANVGWSPRFAPSRWGVRVLGANEPETPFLSILGFATIVPSLALLRRSVYETTPRWDESFGHIFEDADLFLNMALAARVHRLPSRLVRYRRHDQQSTSNTERYHAQEQKLLTKWRNPAGLTDRQRAVVDAAWRFREGLLLPAQGLAACRRHLRRREIRAALRFFAGAAQRYLRYLASVARRGVDYETSSASGMEMCETGRQRLI